MTVDVDAWDALRGALVALDEAGGHDLAAGLLGLATVIATEAAARPAFAKALAAKLVASAEVAQNEQRRRDRATGRRPAPVLDPSTILLSDGREALQKRLQELTVEQLKDIVSAYGMDRDRLAMKWKTADRLIERIVTTVTARAQKGHAFRR